HAAVMDKVQKAFYYINIDLIAMAKKNGISKTVVEKLNQFLIREKNPLDRKPCYCPVDEIQYESIIEAVVFEAAFTPDELLIVGQTFKIGKALNVSFSGAKEWIMPTSTAITISPLLAGNRFTLEIVAHVNDELPPITFYNKAELKEELGTTHPLVKVELDDKIKLDYNIAQSDEDGCCLERPLTTPAVQVSLYHYFRNIVVHDDAINKTSIHVKVCGLKNFIVQNDESLQDVNSPVYPFGTRPDVTGV